MKSFYGKTSYHGKIITEPSVTCSICEDYNGAIGKKRGLTAAEILRAEGWRRYSDTGWICPDCDKLRKAEKAAEKAGARQKRGAT